MTDSHTQRLKSIDSYSNEMLEYLYFFEVMFPKTKEFFDNQTEYQPMLFDIIDELTNMISGYGYLLVGKGTDEENEKVLTYIENLMRDLHDTYPLEFEYTADFLSWVKKHKGE